MAYDIGTHIDLSFLNKKAISTFQTAFDNTEVEVGTAYTFKEGLKAFKQIEMVAL